jgi:hypothetical protein
VNGTESSISAVEVGKNLRVRSRRDNLFLLGLMEDIRLQVVRHIEEDSGSYYYPFTETTDPKQSATPNSEQKTLNTAPWWTT